MENLGVQTVFWFLDVPKIVAVWCLTQYYRTFPQLRPTTEKQHKRDLICVLVILYLIIVLGSLYLTYDNLPINHYERFGASCDDLDLVQLKRLFRRASLIYHPDKNPNPEAVDSFVVLRVAYDTLIDGKKREMYNRIGPGLITDLKTATTNDYISEAVRRMVIGHGMSLLFQFGFGFINPAMRITFWKCVLLSVFVVIELNVISSPQSCGIRVFGHSFLLHELLILTQNLYNMLNVALSRLLPLFVTESRGIPDAEVYQHHIVSQLIKSNARQDYNTTIQPFLQEDGTMIEEMKTELLRMQPSTSSASARPDAAVVPPMSG